MIRQTMRARWVVLAILPLLFCCATVESPVRAETSTLSGLATRADDGSGPVAGVEVPSYRREEVLPWIESRTFLQANLARRRAGLPPLEMRMDLMEAARVHAADMARRKYFSHYSPEGAGPGDRASRLGIRFRAYAENLSRVRNSADPAGMSVIGWLGSPGHRRNLLDETRTGYRFTGIGVARDADGAIYVAQVFLR